MTWTFNEGLTASGSLSADGMLVRMILGDTDTTDQLLADETIAAVLVLQTVVTYAAAACAEVIAASFARKVDVSNLETSVSASQRFQQYSELAKRLRESPPGDLPGGDGTGILLSSIFVGGRTKSVVQARENDTGITQPAFSRTQFDQTGVNDDTTRRDL